MTSRTRRRSLIALAACLSLPSIRAQASETWPTKPVVIVVPSAAGGAADFIARAWAQYLTRAVPGAVVTVDNRPGAGGILGTMAVKNARPDGYTFLVSTNSTHAANVSLYRKPGYDPQRDFVPVGMFGRFSAVLMARNDSPLTSLPELIQYAKQHPGKLNFGYYSSSSQVPSELLKVRAQIDAVGITYKNITQIITDLIGGQVDFAFMDMLSAAPALQNQRLRPLAVSSPQREASLPQVPTVAETLPGYAVQGWIGIHAPAGTPTPIVERASALLLKATTDETVRKALESRGMSVDPMGAAAMRSFVAEDIARWAEWVKLAGIKPQ